MMLIGEDVYFGCLDNGIDSMSFGKIGYPARGGYPIFWLIFCNFWGIIECRGTILCLVSFCIISVKREIISKK